MCREVHRTHPKAPPYPPPRLSPQNRKTVAGGYAARQRRLTPRPRVMPEGREGSKPRYQPMDCEAWAGKAKACVGHGPLSRTKVLPPPKNCLLPLIILV